MEDQIESFDVDSEIEANRPGALGDVETSVDEVEQPSEDSSDIDAKAILDELSDTPEDSGLLDLVNKLGLDRKGEAVEFKTDEEIRETLLKGFDYTQKTQELAETRKAQEAEWNEQMSAKEEEYNQRVQQFEEEKAGFMEDRIQNQIMLDVLTQFKETDPAAYDEIVSSFSAQLNQYNRTLQNPEFNKLKSELDELKGQISSSKKTELDNETVKIDEEWNSGHKGLQQQYGVKMKRLGVPAKWEEVKRVWQAANASGTDLDIESAFFAVHGKEIKAASDAAKKTLETKQRSELRRGAGAPARKSSTPETEEQYRERLMGWAAAQ